MCSCQLEACRPVWWVVLAPAHNSAVLCGARNTASMTARCEQQQWHGVHSAAGRASDAAAVSTNQSKQVPTGTGGPAARIGGSGQPLAGLEAAGLGCLQPKPHRVPTRYSASFVCRLGAGPLIVTAVRVGGGVMCAQLQDCCWKVLTEAGRQAGTGSRLASQPQTGQPPSQKQRNAVCGASQAASAVVSSLLHKQA